MVDMNTNSPDVNNQHQGSGQTNQSQNQPSENLIYYDNNSKNINAPTGVTGLDLPTVSADVLIMMAIQDMNDALTNKQTQDANLGASLAKTEGDYMNFMSGNNGPGSLGYDLQQIKAAGSDQGKLDIANSTFSLDQTTISTTDNLIKSTESTQTTSVTGVNQSMNNNINNANTALQLMGFSVRLLQAQM